MCVTSITGVMNTTAKAKTLTMGGLDVLLEQGSAVNRFGVPLDSVSVDEQGAGGVSSMSFTLEDPSKAVVPVAGGDIRFLDVTNNLPMFTGWIQGWSVRVFGTGRAYDIHCVGVEATLDWMLLGANVTVPSGTGTVAAVQMVIAAATGIGYPLRAFSGTTANGNQAGPIGSLGATVTTGTAVALTAGTTVREAIRTVLAAIPATIAGYGVDTSDGVASVDFWNGLRVYRRAGEPDDYSTLVVNDAIGSAIISEDLAHEIDATGIVRGVYITGGNAAGTGLVSDGSGIPGQIASLSDSTILTASALTAAGLAYLSDKSAAYRGSFNLSDTALFSSNYRAGSVMGLTDNETAASGTYQIGSISKTFNGIRQNWTITYGGLPPRMTTLIRRQTRSTLS